MLSFLKRDGSQSSSVWLRADGLALLKLLISCPTQRARWIEFCRKTLRVDWTWLESYTGRMPNVSERNAIVAFLDQGNKP